MVLLRHVKNWSGGKDLNVACVIGAVKIGKKSRTTSEADNTTHTLDSLSLSLTINLKKFSLSFVCPTLDP
jgi:hypothetical protein